MILYDDAVCQDIASYLQVEYVYVCVHTRVCVCVL
jgi:hypothetical protein